MLLLKDGATRIAVHRNAEAGECHVLEEAGGCALRG